MPTWQPGVSEQSVHNTDRAVLWLRPAVFEKPCIMKNNDATWPNKLVPIVPISPDGLLIMSAVDEQQINHIVPRRRHFVAESLDPNHISPLALPHGTMRGAPQSIEKMDARQVIRIDQEKPPVGSHGFAESDCRGTLRYSYLNKRAAHRRGISNRFVFRKGVLRENGPQS
jgi:hypothetical protein